MGLLGQACAGSRRVPREESEAEIGHALACFPRSWPNRHAMRARRGEARRGDEEDRSVLRELSVQNLALIEDARVELEPGYCAWTGETGAGKSLLLTALGLVLGGKASAELVRQGCGEARASAVFELADGGLRAEGEGILGAEIEDGQLTLPRRVSAQGKGQAHANGMPVAVGTLRALGTRLIDIHGQHEGRALLDPDRQRGWLD